MDQVKIGRFIAECRKKQDLTQMQLAEKLNITDRAVSKWETGRSLPDSSIMLELCDVLQISVNDLLSGEVVTMNDYNKKLEENLLEIKREKEQADKRLLGLEIFIAILVIAILVVAVLVASYVEMADWMRIAIIVAALIPCIIGLAYALKIEQVAGYYQCAECGHKYVPKYSSVLWSMHMGRTRHMRCPKCNKKSWQKKVISK